jgi:hypothetical protein
LDCTEFFLFLQEINLRHFKLFPQDNFNFFLRSPPQKQWSARLATEFGTINFQITILLAVFTMMVTLETLDFWFTDSNS